MPELMGKSKQTPVLIFKNYISDEVPVRINEIILEVNSTTTFNFVFKKI